MVFRKKIENFQEDSSAILRYICGRLIWCEHVGWTGCERVYRGSSIAVILVINYFYFSPLTVTDHGEARGHYHCTSTLPGSTRCVRGHFMDTCLEEEEG